MSAKPIIIAVDAIESIFEKTKEQYLTQFEYYDLEDEFKLSLPENSVAIQMKYTSSMYHVRNSFEEIMQFLQGETDG